jgi:hypothetical protein
MIWALAFVVTVAGVATILYLAQRRPSRREVPMTLLQTVRSEAEMQLAVQRLAAFEIGVKVVPLGNLVTRGAISVGPVPPYTETYDMWVATGDAEHAREILGL